MSNKYQVGDCVILTAPVDGRDDIVGCEGIIKNITASRPCVYFPYPGNSGLGTTWFCEEDKLIPVEGNLTYRVGSRVRVKGGCTYHTTRLKGLTRTIYSLSIPDVCVLFDGDIDLGPNGLGLEASPGKALWLDVTDLELIAALPQIKLSFEDIFEAF